MGQAHFTESERLPVSPSEGTLAARTPVQEGEDGGNVSPMAERIGSAGITPKQEVEVIAEMLYAYCLGSPTGYPTGTNAEITASLVKTDELGLSFLPVDHPSISREGELIDPWGSSYFFHVLARDEMEVRSAGPDRVMFTKDDLCWPEAGP